MPFSYLDENDVAFARLKFTIDGNTYSDGDPEMSGKIFYDSIRSGKTSTTTQVNIEEFKDFFKEALQKGKDVLHLCFSSGLSGTCNSAIIAAEELSEEYPDRKVIVVDSLCASMGQGLLLDYAIALRDEGKTVEEVKDWLEDNKLNLVHYFTVDDLGHLQRGGRISKLTAVFGGLLNIKPVLAVEKGEIKMLGKARGSKQGNNLLVQQIEKAGGIDFAKPILLGYSGISDALLKKYMEDSRALWENGVENLSYACVGSVIGTHAGPGAVAVAFFKK